MTPVELIRDKVQRGMLEFKQAEQQQQAKRARTRPIAIQVWQPPSEPDVKINMDASLSGDSVGAGVVIHNGVGDVLTAGTKRWRAKWTPVISEAKVIWYRLSLARQLGFSRVVLETDCLALISKLKHGIAG